MQGPTKVDLSGEGSAFDARGRRPSTKWTRRLKGWLSWHLVGLAAAVVPRLYTLYCRLVWRTSVVVDETNPGVAESVRHHGRFMALLWHQEVFTVAWAFAPSNPHTLASAGNFGRIITRMLERCNYTVFRGGSSTGTARRRQVLRPMIRHMRTASVPVAYGITVDGSKGPPFRLKRGGLVIARACRTPLFVQRTWYSRKVTLPTWDRTGIPLPFNRIHSRLVGPYWLAPDADDAALERLRVHLEQELLDLAALSVRDADGPAAGDGAQPGYPEGWTPRWPRAWDAAPTAALGLAHGPFDLRSHAHAPPWAARPGPMADDDAAGEGEDGEEPQRAGGSASATARATSS